MITEADTCRKYVLPKLYSSGWSDDQINEQKTFTDGRTIVAGDKIIHRSQKRADYILRYRRDFMIAVIEQLGQCPLIAVISRNEASLSRAT